jgi:hypothetical protein
MPKDATLLCVEYSEQRIHAVEKRRTTIGQAVDQAIKETSEEWFCQHAGLRSREVAAAEDITLVSATVELLKGGSLRVFVGITTRKHNEHLHDWYRFQRQGSLGYVRTEATKPVR